MAIHDQTTVCGSTVAGTGVTGASPAILNAINDAIAPLGGRLAEIPATPERILRALGVV